MPDRRSRRGAHPKDAACFAAAQLAKLRAAVADLSFLLDRGYSPKAATKIVGDRYALIDRQRRALGRCAAGERDVARRREHRARLDEIAGRTVLLDGYNVLLTVESALDGGLVLVARDGAYRDLAAMSGHYKRVESTLSALELIGRTLSKHRCAAALWYFDRPISNSGRLATAARRLAAEHGWPWQVELIDRVDGTLARSAEIVATADSAILDRAGRWLNLARGVIDGHVPEAWVVDLASSPEPGESSAAPARSPDLTES